MTKRLRLAWAVVALCVLPIGPVQAGDVHLVWQADTGAYAQDAGGHAFTLPGLIPGGPDFVWDSPGLFEQRDNGTARLTGLLAALTDPHNDANKWWADIEFHPAMDFLTYTNPAGHLDPDSVLRHGSPKLELDPAAYAPQGPIDPSTWTFHYMDETAATLTNFLNPSLIIDLTQQPTGNDYGDYVFQYGYGANGKNTDLGLSGWLAYSGAYSGTGDVNVSLLQSVVPVPIPQSVSMGLALLCGFAFIRHRQSRHAHT